MFIPELFIRNRNTYSGHIDRVAKYQFPTKDEKIDECPALKIGLLPSDGGAVVVDGC
jgi:hypothetical protein